MPVMNDFQCLNGDRFLVEIANRHGLAGEGNSRYQGAYRLPSTQKEVNNQELPMNSQVKVYPNPVENHFTIDYYLQADSDVRFELYDNTGKKIATLLNGPKKACAY